MSRVWVLRVKPTAEVKTSLASGIAPVDVSVKQDVFSHRELKDFLSEVTLSLPDLPIKKAESRAKNLMDLVTEVKAGDIVLIHGPTILSGVCTGALIRDASGTPSMGFSDPVTHDADSLPEDIKNSMKAQITLSRSLAPEAFKRMTLIREIGEDVGASSLSEAKRMGTLLEAHQMAHLVADILETDGYRCRVSPPGPDGGVDIYAGKGLLGVGDSLLVQVKSGKQVVSGPQIYQILGKLFECGASATLIVSWSGFTAECQSIMNKNPFKTVSWDHNDILGLLDTLPQDVKYKWQKVLKLIP